MKDLRFQELRTLGPGGGSSQRLWNFDLEFMNLRPGGLFLFGGLFEPGRFESFEQFPSLQDALPFPQIFPSLSTDLCTVFPVIKSSF